MCRNPAPGEKEGTKEMKKGTVIATWNMKGGVGKTTAAINLAYDWSMMGYRILTIDLDPQVNMTPIFTKANENGLTIVDVMEEPERARSALRRTRFQGIDIIKGSACLWEGYAEDALHRALSGIRGEYDAILIDCQPSCGTLTRSALYAADMVLIPAVLDRFCLDNLRTAEDILSDVEEDRGKEIKWMVFANKVKGIRSQKSIYMDIMEKHDYPFLGKCISDCAAIPNALAQRKPVARHAKRSTASADFQALAEEVWEVVSNG